MFTARLPLAPFLNARSWGRHLPVVVVFGCCLLLQSKAHAEPGKLPNIVFILADDLGYGDVGCYNPESRIPTPHLDQLAADGMRFTDAHSPATVCTPTRYSLLTGQMAFRIPNGGRVFTGAGGPNLIEEGRLTLPQMLKEKGYVTACFGKWHVGMTFYDAAGEPIHQGGLAAVKRIDFAKPIAGAPIHRGFDHFFGTACCPTTDWLYAYIDGDRVPNPPTQIVDKSALPKHPYSNDCRGGMVASDFDLEEVDLVFLEKSQQFLEKHVRESPDQPFFLYHSAQAVHLPSFPADQFKGKTPCGPHGDFIFELDWIVGQLLETLDRLDLTENTLVMFSSDNGPEVPTVYHMRHDHQHDGARPWRGVKRDTWEGGHRVPFIARWPGKIAPGATSSQTLCLTDILATAAAIVGTELPADAGEDSFNMLPAFLGEDEQPIREYTLHQGFAGAKKLALRRGSWKFLNHQGSGGNNYAKHRFLQEYQLPDTAPDAPAQLYNIDDDPGETTNLYNEQPDLVKQLSELLQQSVDSGRSNETRMVVTKPPADLELDPFYTKYISANGYPIVSSDRVRDYALKEAAYLINMMLAKRPDVRKAMIEGGSRCVVMAYNEYTTDLPEQRNMRPKDYWDARARGLGGSRRDALCSCAEENLLAFPGDPYSTENILIHEFAHNMHLRGLVVTDPTFDDRLKLAYERAMTQGLWKGKYASVNHAEYFAEGVQSWFNNNRPPDHDHNHVDTRKELKEYDRGLAAICEEVFGQTELVYTKPATRLNGHLAGYDSSSAPTFKWPERLRKAKREIYENVRSQGEDRKKVYDK